MLRGRPGGGAGLGAYGGGGPRRSPARGPRGVVAAITPWNDPVAVACGLLGAALATGNTVVHKPSERSPATGHRLARLLAPHFPDGVFALLSGDGPVGAALADQARAWAAELGPLVDTRLRDAVHAQVTAAVAAGARLLAGGVVPDGPGAWYPPTVLADCTDGLAVLREETFGPAAPVVTVDSFEEALTRAADSRYGLAATVLTGSMSHAHQAWRRLPAGTVKINAVFGGAPGGAAHPRGASGHGYGYGPELLDELTATKAVHIEAPPSGW